MGEMVQAAAFWALGLGALGQGLMAIQELDHAAASLADGWRQEAELRTCGLLAAASANLRDAATALALLDPATASRTELAATALAASQRAAYPTSLHPDAAGLCRDEHGLAASLHLQHHSGQPAVWPNWVPTYFFGGPD